MAFFHRNLNGPRLRQTLLVRPILRAFSLIIATPRLWRYIVQPLLVTSATFLAVLILGYLLFFEPLRRGMEGLINNNGPIASGVVSSLAFLFVGLIWLTIAGFAFIAVASILSAFLWERLSFEVEELVIGHALKGKVPARRLMLDGFARLLLAAAVGLAALCSASIPLLPVLLAGYPAMLDYSAPVYARRDVLLGRQMGLIYRNRDAWSFHLIAGVVTLFPIVNLLMLPVMVTAATIMVAESSRPQLVGQMEPAGASAAL